MELNKKYFYVLMSLVFILASISAFLSYLSFTQHQILLQTQRTVNYSYQRAMSDLSDSISNMESSLSKSIYANTPTQQHAIAAKLLKDSGSAKTALAQLPVYDSRLDNINKFISQVGDYAHFLSSKIAKNQPISQEEIQSLASLDSYAKTVSAGLNDMNSQIIDGSISITEPSHSLNLVPTTYSDNANVPPFVNGFHEMNQGFTDYPTLIYDGPFSDHVLTSTSKMLDGADQISQEQAMTIAADFLSVNKDTLSFDGQIEGNLPLFSFSSPSGCITVTRAGGFVNFMLAPHNVSQQSLDSQQADTIAQEFLHSKGLINIRQSYFFIDNGVCTINYAYEQTGDICYPDLIKVGVALDNGEIVSYNASGYLMNHHERALPSNIISPDSARASVSPTLTIVDSKMAFVPTDGLSEVYCYQFLCNDSNGEEVLVYIDAQSGLEERILILLHSDGGTLVM